MSQKLPDEYHIIVDEIMPDVMGRFVSKAGDYGDAWKLLGAKGQFSDINRKFWKLHNSIWLDKELLGEQPDECAEDIIGHCLLLLYILREESTPERAKKSSTEGLVLPPLPASEPARVGEDAARCPATVERPSDVGPMTSRCELFRGHKRLHLTNIGTPNQYQWRDE
jgi:hypothetical protein